MTLDGAISSKPWAVIVKIEVGPTIFRGSNGWPPRVTGTRMGTGRGYREAPAPLYRILAYNCIGHKLYL